MLNALTERHRDCVETIGEMGFAIQTTGNRSTGFMSELLNLDKELSFPLQNGLQSRSGELGRSITRYAVDLKKRLSGALHDPRKNLDAARIEHAALYVESHRHLE